jgi:hypothetical protein
MALPDLLTDPVPLALLTLIIAALLHYQRGLTWSEYRQIHRAKLRFFPLLDRVWPHFVHDKGTAEADDEYLMTRRQSVRSVWKQLVSEGGHPHLISSIKRLPDGSLSQAHVVWTHADGTQTEAYLFHAEDGTAVYAHNETGVTDPEGHLTDRQTDGDPKGVVRAALGVA